MTRYITMRKFGKYGRFANQLFQYSFLRIYADKHNLEMQIPPWIGEDLFGLKTPLVTEMLTHRLEERDDTKHSPVNPPKSDEFVNHDFEGYGQFHTSWYRPYQAEMREWFRPVSVIQDRMNNGLARLREAGTTPIGLHLRRGDYGQLYFYTTPIKWCTDWLDANWPRLDNPVLFIATEDPSLAKDFAKYEPLLVEDLGVSLTDTPYRHFQYLAEDSSNPTKTSMDFYPDFYFLTQCKILLLSNSTFGFAAAMLNHGLQECWRPVLPEGGFVQVDPWNDDVLRHDLVTDYPNIEGLKGNR